MSLSAALWTFKSPISRVRAARLAELGNRGAFYGGILWSGSIAATNSLCRGAATTSASAAATSAPRAASRRGARANRRKRPRIAKATETRAPSRAAAATRNSTPNCRAANRV